MTGYERMEPRGKRAPSSSGVILLPLDVNRMRAASTHMPRNGIAGGLSR